MPVGKKSVGELIFDVFNYMFIAFITFVCIAPMWFVIAASFSHPIELLRTRGMFWWPVGTPTLAGYELVFSNPNIWSGYRNTIIILVMGLTINMVMTTLGGYVLSRKNVLWNRPLTLLIIFTMYFSGGMIPSFLLIAMQLGWLDSFLAVTVPSAVATFNLIICRTAFQAVPDSLEESARIDGANDFVILYRIMVPLSKAMLAVLALFYAVGHWNSWFPAMLYLRNSAMHPLQLVLRQILIAGDLAAMGPVEAAAGADDLVDMARLLVRYATIVVATVPILFVYPFLQKYLTKGVMIGSVKG
jgi:putative aldouronate transport system permease protein